MRKIMLKFMDKVNDLIIDRAVKLTSDRFEKTYVNTGDPKNAEDIVNYIYLNYSNLDVEHFIAFFYDNGDRLCGTYIQPGAVNTVQLDGRTIARKALECDAVGIILAHTHIAANHEPSDSDLLMTYDMVKRFGFLGLAVYDHIIVSHAGWTSFDEDGYLDVIREEIDAEEERGKVLEQQALKELEKKLNKEEV